MLRLLLYLILFILLYLLLNFFAKSRRLHRAQGDGRADLEELVQDPECQVYIPKKDAIRRRIDGRDHYFCSQRCLENFRSEKRVDK